MVLPIAFIFGAAYGALKAKKLKGNKLDMLHYAGSYGIAFSLLALILSIISQRLGLFT